MLTKLFTFFLSNFSQIMIVLIKHFSFYPVNITLQKSSSMDNIESVANLGGFKVSMET